MKKTFFTVSLLAAVMMSFSLHSAETKKIPILWKAKAAMPAKFQIVAFGFLEDKEDVIFAYQIKDVAELMKLKSYYPSITMRTTTKIPDATPKPSGSICRSTAGSRAVPISSP